MFYSFWREVSNYIFSFIPLLICGVLILNAFSNNGGVPELWLLNDRIEILEQKIATFKSEADYLEHKVALISGPQIDADLLEELAHKLLGFVHSNNLVIPLYK